MLLPHGDHSAGTTHAGYGDGVQPSRRHLRHRAKPPDGAIQGSLLEKERRPGYCLKKPVQLSIVSHLALQDERGQRRGQGNQRLGTGSPWDSAQSLCTHTRSRRFPRPQSASKG
ncbi:hypothetical protein StoSoilB19_18490 [Arthrobacter sp. StoSoilB19]|nr:hypothetical protein StoSoilB19_18490 [Arthrobacter sp. StoSoilB19]